MTIQNSRRGGGSLLKIVTRRKQTRSSHLGSGIFELTLKLPGSHGVVLDEEDDRLHSATQTRTATGHRSPL